MKKMTLLIMLVIVAMIGTAKERTGYIKTGQTWLDKPMVFDTNDTIKTSETVNIIVYSEQTQPSKQDFYLTLGSATGSPSVAVTAYGKCFAGDAYVQIGSPVTWTSVGNNPVKIAAAAPNQYRYFKVALVHSGATGTAKITAFEMKLWLTGGLASAGTLTDGTMTINSGAIADATTASFSGRITGTGGATVSGAATNINASSNFATNIGTGTTNSAVSIGGGSNTVAVNSSDWDITTAGVMTGIGAITADGLVTASLGANVSGAAVNLNASSNFATNIGTGTTTEAVTVGNAANTIALVAPTTVTGALTATGGLSFATGSTVHWAKGGAPLAVATGTDAAATAGDRYWVELEIPHNASITGLSYLVGSVGGTDSVMVHLYNSAGTQVATSKKTGAAHGDLVATAAEIQSVAFTAPYAAVAGKYFAAIQFNGTTAKFRAYLIPGSKFVAATAGGTYDVAVASITPGTTWTANKGPIIATY